MRVTQPDDYPVYDNGWETPYQWRTQYKAGHDKYLNSAQICELASLIQQEKIIPHLRYQNTWKITVTLMTLKRKKNTPYFFGAQ